MQLIQNYSEANYFMAENQKPELVLSGRRKIFTPYDVIDDSNIVNVLTETYPQFMNNVSEIDYLFDYLRGLQPILGRKKEVRPEINNKIVENHAYSIVQFLTGYLLEKPIQYVARKEAVDNDSLISFNDYLEIESKESKDKRIAHDQATCGVAYRLVIPNRTYDFRVDEGNKSPFIISTINPRLAYVVYSTGLESIPKLGVIVYRRKDAGNHDHLILQAYTERKFWEFDYGAKAVLIAEENKYGAIPLIEYPYNEERIGAFEIVIPLLNAINKVQSNRLDGVEQFVQALLVFKNADIDKEKLKQLLELGAIKITDAGELKANVEYLTQELNQEQVQKLKDDLLNVVYHIVGLPNRSKSGGGDTGQAIVYRNGWEETASKIQDVELMFKDSEKQFLKVALAYTKTLTLGKNKLKLSDIEVKFTRKNYENTYQKAQILDLMLKNGKVAPRLAFVTCGLFQDPEGAYNESLEYIAKNVGNQEENGGGDGAETEN